MVESNPRDSHLVLGWHCERLAVLSRQHRVGSLVADKSLVVRIELELGPQREPRLIHVVAIISQMLPRSLERVLMVVVKLTRVELREDLFRRGLLPKSVGDVSHVTQPR